MTATSVMVDGPAPPGPVSSLPPRSEALAALKVSGSVGLAVFPIGIAFGMLVAHSGLALAATVGLHLWRRNAVLSILGGTVIYVVLVSTLFAS